jgi:hypothetical protein
MHAPPITARMTRTSSRYICVFLLTEYSVIIILYYDMDIIYNVIPRMTNTTVISFCQRIVLVKNVVK